MARSRNISATSRRYAFGNIYRKSAGSSANYVYRLELAAASRFDRKTNPAAKSPAALTDQANTEGAAGYVYWFSAIIAGVSKEVYFKPAACVGPLCRSTSPL